MMRLRKTLWLMSASGLVIMSCCPNAQANILPRSSLPDAITSVYNTHFTYTSHPEEVLLSSALYPLPKDLGRGWGEFHNTTITQLASVCFVTDTNDCSGNQFSGNNADDDDGHGAPGGNEADNGNQDDYDLDNAERCKKEGYNKTSCLPDEIPSNYCLYDSSYFEDCTCPSGYTTCTPPYYGVGTACGNKYASCEKDTERACQELNPGYVDECGTGQQLSDDRCSYDNTYGTCCNTCAGYDNTTIPEKDMSRTGKPVWIATGRSITKSSTTLATDFWIVAPWARMPAPKPVSPVPPPSTATASLVPIKARSPAVPAPIPVPSKPAPTAIINPAANQVIPGTAQNKPALPSVQVLINIPVPAPVMLVDPAKPVMGSILPAVAHLHINGIMENV